MDEFLILANTTANKMAENHPKFYLIL